MSPNIIPREAITNRPDDVDLSRLLRYVDEELRPWLREQPQDLERNFVAYIVAGYRMLFPDLDFAEQDLRSLQALRRKMITLVETYQRERQAGHRKALLSERAEYVRLFWGEETSQAFRQRLPAVDVAFWPSLSDLHAAWPDAILCNYWSQATDCAVVEG